MRPRNCDPKGFISKLKENKKMGTFVHVFYYPKDVIMSVFSLEEQDERKDKELAYKNLS